MPGKKENRFISQVQNRVSGEETGEEELRGVSGLKREKQEYQL